MAYEKHTYISDITVKTPFLAALMSAAEWIKTKDASEEAELYVTGEYALSIITSRQLPKRIDIKGNLTNGELIALCEQRGYNYMVYGESVLIWSEDKRFSYSEVKNGNLSDDALTHDFSINAFYISVKDGSVYDPANAFSDMEAKVLNTTLPPLKAFSTDPIRILQMVRICCENDYSVSEEMLAAAKASSHLLKDAPIDAVRNTLFSIIMSDTAKIYEGKDITGEASPVLRGLYMLREMDVFAYILPEFELGRGVEQKKRYHIYDVQGHMLHTCAEAPPRLYMRMAALLHDIGKPEAYIRNNEKNMHGHDKIGAAMARDALRRLRCKEDFINKVCRIIAIHMYDVAGIAKVETLRKRFAQWGYRLTQDLIDFRFADVKGSGCPDRKSDSGMRFAEVFEDMKAENVPFSIYELKITGREISEIMDLHTGTDINDIKRELLRICAVSPEYNQHDRLVEITTEMQLALKPENKQP